MCRIIFFIAYYHLHFSRILSISRNSSFYLFFFIFRQTLIPHSWCMPCNLFLVCVVTKIFRIGIFKHFKIIFSMLNWLLFFIFWEILYRLQPYHSLFSFSCLERFLYCLWSYSHFFSSSSWRSWYLSGVLFWSLSLFFFGNIQPINLSTFLCEGKKL